MFESFCKFSSVEMVNVKDQLLGKRTAETKMSNLGLVQPALKMAECHIGQSSIGTMHRKPLKKCVTCQPFFLLLFMEVLRTR